MATVEAATSAATAERMSIMRDKLGKVSPRCEHRPVTRSGEARRPRVSLAPAASSVGRLQPGVSEMARITASTLVAAVLAGIPSAIYGPASSSPARTLVVTAYEYSFQSPDSVPAGVVTVRLVDRGRKAHQVAIARLDDTASLDRVMRSLVADKVRTGGIRWVGGIETAIPGESSETTLPLASGRYVLICSYDGDNGLAHMSLGMIRSLVVTPVTPATTQSLPATQTTIELSDYHIALSRPLHSGRQLVRVLNVGKQRHHLNVTRIVGNATTDEIMKWDGKSQPAPLQDMSGGVAAMDPGGTSVIEMDLAPGRYALACVLSNGGGSKPHYLLGMHREIVVH
jgi:uncharacterized cupredoxin-like copper-binding protein